MKTNLLDYDTEEEVRGQVWEIAKTVAEAMHDRGWLVAGAEDWVEKLVEEIQRRAGEVWGDEG